MRDNDPFWNATVVAPNMDETAEFDPQTPGGYDGDEGKMAALQIVGADDDASESGDDTQDPDKEEELPDWVAKDALVRLLDEHGNDTGSATDLYMVVRHDHRQVFLQSIERPADRLSSHLFAHVLPKYCDREDLK